MQGMVTEPLFKKGNIQTPSPISTEKSVYIEFPDNSIKCFSSKQKQSVQVWCLIDSFNTKIEGKAMFLSTAYQEYFNNQ